jgi:putative copper resistance protein D
MLLFGGSLFRLLLGSGAAAIDRSLGRQLKWAAVAASASAVVWLMLEAGSMGEGWADVVDPATVRAVLSDTAFGHAWLLRLMIAVPLTAVFFAEWQWIWRAAFAGLFLASLALTGPAAMDEGISALLHPANHAVHLLSGGAWIGALLPLWLILRDTKERHLALATEACERFARLGHVAVVLVILSGVVNGRFLIGGLTALFTTLYGITLIVKLGFVGGMLICATLNRFAFAPRLLRDSGALKPLKRSVIVEIVCGVGVLMVVSLLGILPPAL